MEWKMLAEIFWKEIEKNFALNDEITRIGQCYELTHQFFNALTQADKLQFATQFTRIAFACQKYDLSKRTQWQIYEFRKRAKEILFQKKKSKENEPIAQLGVLALARAVAEATKVKIPAQLKQLLPPDDLFYQPETRQYERFLEQVRVVVVEYKPDEKVLICQSEDQTDGNVRVRYDETSVNELFTNSINALQTVWKRPATLNLLEVQVDKNGDYLPKVFILEPDFLMDISTVSYCFSLAPPDAKIHLLRKFIPVPTNLHLMLGNVANFFIDELMNNPEASFQQTFPKAFRLNPLAFTLFEDKEVLELMQQAQLHFATLQRVLNSEFAEHDIKREDCYLEPSFFAEKYGIQGRLDVWYQHPTNEQNSAIVELKSGSAYKANQYGISESHYMQALLYDLLIKSALQKKDPRNYILYSKMQRDALRYAPPIKAKQYEALEVRNQMIVLEELLVNLNQQKEKNFTVLDRLQGKYFKSLGGFLSHDVELFATTLHRTREVERAYFLAFASFIAREHQIARTGVQGMEAVNGLATLWLNSFQEKNENFEIISHLKILENHARADEPILSFQKTTGKTNALANFRKGDIAILYPANDPDSGTTALENQIFKCSVVEIDKTTLRVRLRYKQFNDSIFNQTNQLWVLEHDQLDHSFNFMYQGIFSFLKVPIAKRQLLLTEQPPQKPSPLADLPHLNELLVFPKMTDEQQRILKKALLSTEYFLLWGPPGTGKTSVMLRAMVEYVLRFTDEDLLLLAYTNRAVDEICEAVEAAGAAKEYLRIGSSLSTDPRFQEALLDKKIETVSSRRDLKAVIASHRIFVATISSILTRQDLFQLKSFQRVIIDEASQVLEPMLVGLLPHFKQFILVGDHKQLPAVVQQEASFSEIRDESLLNIGLTNLKDSFFERLFLRCRQNNWDWAFDMLSYQGRMHADLMAFPNRFFYENRLQILPEYCNVNQSNPLSYLLPDDSSPLVQAIAQHRLLYLPTPISTTEKSYKTNAHEAQRIAELTHAFCQLYRANGLPIDPHKTIGIITPYRAQIAQIRQALEAYDAGYEAFSVDTVERYQGSARDVILLSVCLNHPIQLQSLVSLSTEGGVDRKLNVALTRAKNHLVIVGNATLMNQNPLYRQLLSECSGVETT